jgi:hypothetical protein
MAQLPIAYLLLLFLSFSSMAQEHVSGSFVNLEATHPETWENYLTNPDFTIDYHLENCQSQSLSNQAIVVFRIVNLTDQSQTVSWNKEIWRDGKCANCHDLDSQEGAFSVNLLPHESIEGSCASKENKALYIFGNFIALTPRMSQQRLTGFRLINVANAIQETNE